MTKFCFILTCLFCQVVSSVGTNRVCNNPTKHWDKRPNSSLWWNCWPCILAERPEIWRTNLLFRFVDVNSIAPYKTMTMTMLTLSHASISFLGGNLDLPIWYLTISDHIKPRISFKFPFTMSTLPKTFNQLTNKLYRGAKHDYI